MQRLQTSALRPPGIAGLSPGDVRRRATGDSDLCREDELPRFSRQPEGVEPGIAARIIGPMKVAG